MHIETSESARFYHTGEAQKPGYDSKNRRVKPPKHIDRMVIAWDMEGISHEGQHRPQSPVLFGCSADTGGALCDYRLGSRTMLEYILSVAEQNPHAIHVGYGFKYDANMLIYGLSERTIVKLWRTGRATFAFDDQYVWTIRWIPGKMFTLSRRWGKRRNTRAKTSLTIYDYSSFFGTGFLDAAEQILGDELSADDRDVIAHGKQARGTQSWNDLPVIRHYWEREIVLIRRVFERFRDVMYRAGFALQEWYGPGALANYINATRQLRPKMAAATTTALSVHGQRVMPDEVHEASKRAFSGGRFELFRAGRIRGPIYAVDINSAYPYALTKIPSLHPDEGQWAHVDGSAIQRRGVQRFGVYRIRFRAPHASPLEYRPMPLFWRNHRGLISYPAMAHGWYWSPEATLAQHLTGVEIMEGWEWQSNEREFPWLFLQEMYDTRSRLGKENLLSMPFKLGPNSLYGKYAQTVGWDQKAKLPPKSHALPVAGWTTSYCRAMLYSAMLKAPGKIIAVETDAIYTTADPRDLGISIGKDLGEWGLSIYDEMLYIQSGMYHYKKDGEWTGVRSRGINRGEYPYELAASYVDSLKGGGPWDSMKFTTKPRFIGAGAAIASNAPTKSVMTSWRSIPKEMTLGDTGKRIHVPNACSLCKSGVSPSEAPHPLMIHSLSDGETLSFPRSLPWESRHTPEVSEIRRKHALEKELISR